jgi:hypothetical protein
MKSLCFILLTVACATHAAADEPRPLFDGRNWAMPGLREEWRCRQTWFPNEYRCKPLPHVGPAPKGCVNDYCPKPLPAVTANAKGCGNDYCPKACPLVLGKLCEPWYTCPRPDCERRTPGTYLPSRR